MSFLFEDLWNTHIHRTRHQEKFPLYYLSDSHCTPPPWGSPASGPQISGGPHLTAPNKPLGGCRIKENMTATRSCPMHSTSLDGPFFNFNPSGGYVGFYGGLHYPKKYEKYWLFKIVFLGFRETFKNHTKHMPESSDKHAIIIPITCHNHPNNMS